MSRIKLPTMQEIFKFSKTAEKSWEVKFDMTSDPAGFTLARGSHANGWNRYGSWAPIYCKKKFEQAEVNMGQCPPNDQFDPKDVASVILGKPVPGLTATNDVLDKVITFAARSAEKKFKGLNFTHILYMPTSKASGAPRLFAQELSKYLHKPAIGDTVVKQTDPDRLGLDPEKIAKLSPAGQKKLQQTLDRMKKSHRETGTFQVRKNIHKRDMDFFTGMYTIGPGASRLISSRGYAGGSLMEDDKEHWFAKVILVDDFVASGKSMNEAKKTLELGGVKVIAMASIFMIEQ